MDHHPIHLLQKENILRDIRLVKRNIARYTPPRFICCLTKTIRHGGLSYPEKETFIMTPLKWVFVIFAVLAVVDAIRSYINDYFGLVTCDGVVLLILIIMFLMSRKRRQ